MTTPSQLPHGYGEPYRPPQQDHNDDPAPEIGRITSLMCENQELRSQVEQLRSERTRLLDTQRRMMDLMGTTVPEKVVHDLRNVLNERDLLKALVDQIG
jgi:hypothetical protein